jgi:hypothetical protein
MGECAHKRCGGGVEGFEEGVMNDTCIRDYDTVKQYSLL